MYDATFLYGPIAVFPNIALSWRVPKAEDITPESLKLFFMLQPKLDVLVLGVGSRKNLDKVRKQVVKAVEAHRIGLEIAPTVSFYTNFNQLILAFRKTLSLLSTGWMLNIAALRAVSIRMRTWKYHVYNMLNQWLYSTRATTECWSIHLTIFYSIKIL